MKNLFLACIAILSITQISCKKAEGEKAAVADAATVVAAVGQEVPVNVASSVVNWEGAKPTGTHTGTISLSEGMITIKEGGVAGGSFILDMNSITVTDIEGDMKANLEGHLKGLASDKADDFFNTPKYPTGKFEITKVTNLENDAEGTHLVYGNLTLKDVTKEVGFKANIAVNGTDVTVSTPSFTIDRTQWGIQYGSKTIFDNLGDKFINDEIGLTINLSASKQVM